MVKNIFLHITFLIVAFITIKAQEMPVLSFSVPSQNNIKFNRFIQNPTYSFVGEDNTYISMYHRNQWIEFNDSPKAYMLSYTGRFNEKNGLGIGIYQQSTGVITSFGAIGNYAHNIRLNDDMNLTLGFNLAYYSSGIDNNRTITAQDDPLLLSFRSTSLVTIKPGVNLSYKNFDLGIYAENLVDYDFKTSEMASEYIDRTYSSQLMYTHNFNAATGLFEETDMRLALTAQMTDTFGTGFGGSILTNFPRMGWIQLGVDNYYGVGAGIGAHISKRLSIGYTYERTIKEGLVNLGPTHEVNLVFAIQNSRTPRISTDFVKSSKTKHNKQINTEPRENIGVTTTTTTTTTETGSTQPNNYNQTGTSASTSQLEILRKAQLERIEQLQAQLDSENQYLLDILLKENELNNLRKAELEERIRNLQLYAQRQQQANIVPAKDIKTIVLRSANPPFEKIEPKTVEDLKNARNGYYLVSKPINTIQKSDFVSIKRFDRLPDAVTAYNIAFTEEKNRDLYIIHVDNPDGFQNYQKAGFQETRNTFDGNSKANQNANTQSQSGYTDSITFSGLEALTPRASKAANASGSDGNRQEDTISKEKVLGSRLITSLPISKDELALNPEETLDITAKKNEESNNPEIKNSSTNNNSGQNLSSNSKQPFNTKQNDNIKTTSKTQNRPKKIVKQYDDDYDHETRRNSVNLSLLGVEPGYYIVANVFSQFSNAENFLEDLKSQGLDPAYFKNPRNKYTYVYLKRFDEWRSASKSFHSKLNNTYIGKIWIMSINID